MRTGSRIERLPNTVTSFVMQPHFLADAECPRVFLVANQDAVWKPRLRWQRVAQRLCQCQVELSAQPLEDGDGPVDLLARPAHVGWMRYIRV